MAIQIDLIKQYCAEAGHEILRVDDDQIDFKCSKIDGRDVDFSLRAILRDEGKMFEVVSMGFVPNKSIKNTKHLQTFLFYLLNFAWNTNFGTPEMDTDGEVRLLLEMPLEDNTLTFQQFKKIVDSLVFMSMKMGIEADGILKTGNLPQGNNQESNAQSALIALLSALADPNVQSEVKQQAVAAAEALLNDPDITEQIKLLVRAALGANIPDSI